MAFQLDGYLERIGFEDAVQPTLKTLIRLTRLHTRHIPFENLNPLLGIPVKLDTASLYEKMVAQKRGGYCFENNGLFYEALKSIGFNVEPLAGRVLWNQPEDKMTAQTHMLLHVKINGEDYLTDVGFGGNNPTEPLKFEIDSPQSVFLGTYKYVQHKDHYFLKGFIADQWRTLYRFKPIPSPFIDRKVANWYTSTHPDSHFTRVLTVARAGKDCRLVLSDNLFKRFYEHRPAEKNKLSTPEEMLEVLKSEFGLELPPACGLKQRLSRFFDD